MTPEQLLMDRYKVIAPWPAMGGYRVGDVITDPGGNQTCYDQNGIPVHPHDWYLYPHLFRKLEWWEDREPGDMPEYVKCISTPDQRIFPNMVKRITDWFCGTCGRIDSEDNTAVLDTNCFIPATEAEYLAYQQQKTVTK